MRHSAVRASGKGIERAALPNQSGAAVINLKQEFSQSGLRSLVNLRESAAPSRLGQTEPKKSLHQTPTRAAAAAESKSIWKRAAERIGRWGASLSDDSLYLVQKMGMVTGIFTQMGVADLIKGEIYRPHTWFEMGAGFLAGACVITAAYQFGVWAYRMQARYGRPVSSSRT